MMGLRWLGAEVGLVSDVYADLGTNVRFGLEGPACGVDVENGLTGTRTCVGWGLRWVHVLPGIGGGSGFNSVRKGCIRLISGVSWARMILSRGNTAAVAD